MPAPSKLRLLQPPAGEQIFKWNCLSLDELEKQIICILHDLETPGSDIYQRLENGNVAFEKIKISCQILFLYKWIEYEFGIKDDELSKELGWARAHIANIINNSFNCEKMADALIYWKEENRNKIEEYKKTNPAMGEKFDRYFNNLKSLYCEIIFNPFKKRKMDSFPKIKPSFFVPTNMLSIGDPFLPNLPDFCESTQKSISSDDAEDENYYFQC